MNFTVISKRLATVGVASALAAGALVGATATSADAVTASDNYTCTVPLLGAQTFPVTISSAALDLADSLPAGITFGAGALDALSSTGHAVDMSMTAPAIVVQTLASLGTLTGVSSPDLAIPFGATAVPVQGLALTGAPVINPDGSAVFNLAGSNGAFSAPAAGDYDITLPAAFTFVASTTSTDFPQIPVQCVSAAPVVLKHMTVTKNSSATTAKAVHAKIKKGTAAVVNSTVTGGFNAPTGKVAIYDGAKKLATKTLSSTGKAKFSVAKLAVGVHKLSVRYLGDGFRNASKSAVTKVTVTK
ncbi:MAG: Ig-like domain repeat protein [Nocardioides sp.]